MNKVVIRCKCGYRIHKRDVLQMRFYLSLFGPSFVAVHYRCGRCKHFGKQLVEEQRWSGFATGKEARQSKRQINQDLDRLKSMGEITPEEVVDFHFSLNKLCEDEFEEAVE